MKPIPYESRYKIKWLPWFCICKIMVIRWTCPWKSNQIWMILRTIIWWQVVTFDWSWPMTIWWLVRLDYLSKTMSAFKKKILCSPRLSWSWKGCFGRALLSFGCWLTGKGCHKYCLGHSIQVLCCPQLLWEARIPTDWIRRTAHSLWLPWSRFSDFHVEVG